MEARTNKSHSGATAVLPQQWLSSVPILRRPIAPKRPSFGEKTGTLVLAMGICHFSQSPLAKSILVGSVRHRCSGRRGGGGHLSLQDWPRSTEVMATLQEISVAPIAQSPTRALHPRASFTYGLRSRTARYPLWVKVPCCSASSANHSFQGTAGKLRLPVPYGLRPSAAPELKRWAS
jgi:hypothetical protein